METDWIETKEKISSFLDSKIAPIKDELAIQKALISRITSVLQEFYESESVDKRETAPSSLSPNKSPRVKLLVKEEVKSTHKVIKTTKPAGKTGSSTQNKETEIKAAKESKSHPIISQFTPENENPKEITQEEKTAEEAPIN